ncbi:hypothetical protein [Austwickia chelonae]|uniref:hypothetical protein n=1 Tax=Austwickia chelonae TaxID=100225 RepID=UPI0013C3678C|nr:hypothetical protein [Austwickia chelonae]
MNSCRIFFSKFVNFPQEEGHSQENGLQPIKDFASSKYLEETQNEMRKIGYQILILFAGGMTLAALIILAISMLKYPGDTPGAINSWYESLIGKSADGLQPSAAALALDAVMVATFISVPAGARPNSTTRDTPWSTANTQIMIDKTVSYTLFLGA